LAFAIAQASFLQLFVTRARNFLACATATRIPPGKALQRGPARLARARFRLSVFEFRPSISIALNEHYVGHGEIIYRLACKLGCEGIVSKRLGSLYRSGRQCGAGRRRIGGVNTASTTRISLRLMFRYAPDTGAKANIARLPRRAKSGVQQIIAYNLLLSTTAWLLQAELFPNDCRDLGRC
jgi:hypothetical protein